MSEPFIEKQAISTEPANVNWEKHKRKSHRFFPTESQSESKYESSLVKIVRYFPKPTLLLYNHLQQIFQKSPLLLSPATDEHLPKSLTLHFEVVSKTSKLCARHKYV